MKIFTPVSFTRSVFQFNNKVRKTKKSLHYFLFSFLFLFSLIADLSAQGTCATATVIHTLPYSEKNISTCGNGSHYSDYPLCLENNYFAGEDAVFTYTPAADECINIRVDFVNKKNDGTYAGLAVLGDCPDNREAACHEISRGLSDIHHDGSMSIGNLGLKGGRTYYILISGGQSRITPYGCFDFNISISRCAVFDQEPNSIIPAVSGGIQKVFAECGNNLGFEAGDLSKWEACHYDDQPLDGCKVGGDCNQPGCTGTSTNNGVCTCTGCGPVAPCKPNGTGGECTIQCDRPGLVPGVNSVNGSLGTCSTIAPAANVGARHTVTSGPGKDPNTDNVVPVVAPGGGSYSVRIGNQEPGHQAECMWQSFMVTKENALFTYLYAVVLEDPDDHTPDQRPRFEMTISGSDGKPVPCGGLYKVVSNGASADGFVRAKNPQCGEKGAAGSVWYKNWTAVGTDLSGLIGQQVTIKFCTADCGKGGHYGYAYVDTYCSPLDVSGTSLCTTSGSAELVAPAGFKSYTWYSGPAPSGTPLGTGQKITINNPANNSIYTVKMQLVANSTCYVTITDTIKVLTGTSAGDTTICDSYTGTIQLKASANDAGASYSWTSDPPGFTSDKQNPAAPAPKQNTTYTVTMKSAGGCTVTSSVKVTTKVCVLSVTVNPLEVCAGSCGNITAKSADGILPITYAWSGGLPATPGPHEVCPTVSTTYTVTVTDATGLTATAESKVTVNPIPSITVNGATICAGQSANLNAGGANTYKWSPAHDLSSATSSSVIAKPTASTTYTVTGTTAAGCTNTATSDVIVNPIPVLTATSATVCSGNEAILTVDGASTYAWTPSAGLNAATGASVTSGATTTTYTIVGTSLNGCTNSVTSRITVNPVPRAGFKVGSACLGLLTEFNDISVIASGTITSWNWDLGDGKTSTQQHPSHTYAGIGTYTVTLIVTSDQGCSDTVKNPLTVYPIPVVHFGPFAKGCRPVCVTFKDSSTVASGTINKWLWDLGDGTTSTEQNPKNCYKNAGTYNVSLTVSSDKGCTQTKKINDIITVYPYPTADFSASPQPTSVFDPKITFKDLSSGDPVSWEWTFWDDKKDSITTSILQNPVYTYSDAGTYQVRLVVKNSYGCPDTITKFVVIRPEWSFYIPNTFTPNGDLKNDGFIGKSWNVIEHQMWIFDRWGNMVYTTGKTKDPESAVPWDGRANNGIETAQIDTYVWLVILKDIFGNKHKYIGHVNLIR